MSNEIKFKVYHPKKGVCDVYGFDKNYVYLENMNSPEYLENILPFEQCKILRYNYLYGIN